MTTDPIVLELQLSCTPETAFSAFAERIGSWWPVGTHSLGVRLDNAPPEDVVIEGYPGGRIYELSPTGVERLWGRITDWETGALIGFSWHVGRDPNEATHVTVRFSRSDTGGTCVELTHRGWDVLGEIADRERKDYAEGWKPVLFEGFAAFCADLPDARADARTG